MHKKAYDGHPADEEGTTDTQYCTGGTRTSDPSLASPAPYRLSYTAKPQLRYIKHGY